ncbi:MAG: D-tyrosyl-tRNA(Tyr) deacylase [Bacteroidetes bacterium]|nr:MAG: D-tyrosyl-tRNA(Tyr) deacylase [Bacteroidota bacterium]
MRTIIQRVREASVTIDENETASIQQGFLILLGIEGDDTQEDADWLIQKTSNMRVFGDAEGKMNLSVQEIKGSFLVVSQFTLHASTKKGNRPSFIRAARPEQAIPLYEYFIQKLHAQTGLQVETGKFAADMKVNLCNDGPVTIFMDSKNKE